MMAWQVGRCANCHLSVKEKTVFKTVKDFGFLMKVRDLK